MAEEGFLLAPLITTNDEFLAALSHAEYEKYITNHSNTLSRIVNFRISCEHLSVACADEINVSFEKVHGLEFGRIH